MRWSIALLSLSLVLAVGGLAICADTTDPTIHNCPDDVEADTAAGARDAQVWWTEPTATDDESGIASFTSTHMPGERFHLGITLVTYVATDGAGNTSYCSFLIIVHETLDVVEPSNTGQYLNHSWPEEEEAPKVGELVLNAVYEVGEVIEGSCMVINCRGEPVAVSNISMTFHSVKIGNDFDVRELLDSQRLPFDSKTKMYSFTIGTEELEPGYYDIQLRLPFHDHQWLRVEIVPSSGAPSTLDRDDTGVDAFTTDFETGDLRGWAKAGDAFDHQPTYGDNPAARDREPSNHEGEWWIGGFEQYQRKPGQRPGDIQHDVPTGTLTSTAFGITGDKIAFLVGGGRHPLGDPEGACVVTLIIDGDVVLWATGEDSETMERVVWDVSAYRGLTARIRIVDEHTGHWGHVNCDDFQMTDGGVRVPFAAR